MGKTITRTCPGQQSFLNDLAGYAAPAATTQPRTTPAATEISAPRFSTQKIQETGTFSQTQGQVSGKADRYEEQLLKAAQGLRTTNTNLKTLDTILDGLEADMARLTSELDAFGTTVARVAIAVLREELASLDAEYERLNGEAYGTNDSQPYGDASSEFDKKIAERDAVIPRQEALKVRIAAAERENTRINKIESGRASLALLSQKVEQNKREYGLCQEENNRLSALVDDLFEKLKQVATEKRFQEIKTKVNEIVKWPAPRKRSGVTEFN